MWLKLDLDQMIMEIQLNGYRATSREDWDSAWCRLDCSFRFDGYIDYSQRNAELIMCAEVDCLKKQLDEFIDGQMCADSSMEFIEPDFEVFFHPGNTESDTEQNVQFDRLGNDLSIPYMDWKVNLWNSLYPTNNCFSVRLYKDDVLVLRDYLRIVIGELNENSDEVTKYYLNGNLYGQF